MRELRAHIPRVAAALGLSVADDWTGVDAVWPLLERMREDGANVLIRLDGGRTAPGDPGPYTIHASGGPLGAHVIRTDAEVLDDGLAHVIARYASEVWGIASPRVS